MPDLLRITKTGAVAVITIDNPPVNALSPGVPSGIAKAIQEIEADRSVKAAVVIGAGRTFVAGADIREFAKITAGKGICLEEINPVLLRVENCSKPVVMAIHGTAFGGGLELAMAGHYRIALRNAQLGQPEVKLGLIPGAAGTLRLPRLAGVAKAVEMCAQGNPISADEAFKLSVIDRVADSDLLDRAIAFANEIADKLAPKTRERNDKLGTPQQNTPIFAAAREHARKKQRNLIAPLAAIDAVEAATVLPFEQGCEKEHELFNQCLYSDQSKALIHAFFGEREVAKIPDLPKDTRPFPINSVAVVGAGTMGAGIAMVFANAGIPVLLKDTDQSALDRGLASIQKNYAGSVKRGRFTQEFVDERLKPNYKNVWVVGGALLAKDGSSSPASSEIP